MINSINYFKDNITNCASKAYNYARSTPINTAAFACAAASVACYLTLAAFAAYDNYSAYTADVAQAQQLKAQIITDMCTDLDSPLNQNLRNQFNAALAVVQSYAIHKFFQRPGLKDPSYLHRIEEKNSLYCERFYRTHVVYQDSFPENLGKKWDKTYDGYYRSQKKHLESLKQDKTIVPQQIRRRELALKKEFGEL